MFMLISIFSKKRETEVFWQKEEEESTNVNEQEGKEKSILLCMIRSTEDLESVEGRWIRGSLNWECWLC